MFPVLTPPTDRAYASSAWGADRSYRGGWHNGIDFPAPDGAAVRAAAAGIVRRVDNYDDSHAGRWVLLDHGNGVLTAYMHSQQNLVNEGQRVSRGQRIALVGRTGTASSGPHVHFAMALTAPALAAYAARFGKPTTGWGSVLSFGTYAPSEPLMSGVTYRADAKALAERAGVKFYAASWAVIALAGFVAWGAWRLLR